MHKSQKLINHVALVLDGSSSMTPHRRNVVKVADEQIKHLALRSEELSQETRVSVYLFADRVECLIFDMDVMRLPSIADLYSANGMTALIDATVRSQEDLNTTSQIYGDHAFLTFVLTDGAENRSMNSPRALGPLTAGAKENWTVAFLVPDSQGEAYLTRMNVPAGNIAIWDTASATGIADVGAVIRSSTDSFMTNRAQGIRGTRNMFSTGVDAVNAQTVHTNLSAIKPSGYNLFDVWTKERIDNFVKSANGFYVVGKSYYQLSKTETIQPQKQVAVLEKSTGKVFTGPQARALIGLPSTGSVRVRPDQNPYYDIFIQSTSINRNLVPNTKVLVLN